MTKQILSKDKIIIKLTAETHKELIQKFWRIFNNGNCINIKPGIDIEDDTGLYYFSDIVDRKEHTEGYFRTDPEEFIKTLQNIELIKLMDSKGLYCSDEDIPANLIEESKSAALNIFNLIPEENILAKRKQWGLDMLENKD